MNMPAHSAAFTSPTSKKIYEIAKSLMGQHITLDQSVPLDLGCAEAVSYILKSAGIPMPEKGIAGTAEMYAWLRDSGYFEMKDELAPGRIIISPSDAPGALLPHGHVGVVALYGVLSNDSVTGLFNEHMTIASWHEFFALRAHFPVYYFECILNLSNCSS